ncbi:MAG: glycosyltransferase family 2 protein [Bacilli bacterium]|jgi:glycosyltransferase involved in cell wall biosynthesis
MRDKILLALVVPCYNEEDVLKETNYRLTSLLVEMIQEQLIQASSYILYVDDGSKDKTWEMIKDFYKQSEMVQGVKLSRNRGHQNALLAGLFTALNNCDAAISIDADLQDDIRVIKEMVSRYRQGDEIVLGVRDNRDNDSIIKRGTAEAFYKVMKKLGTNTIKDHADFRLLSNRALQELKNYNEVNLFLRGLILELGFPTSCVYYQRQSRMAGVTKYSLFRMLNLALAGITSFTIRPIRLIFIFGFIFSILSLGFAVGIAIAAICGAFIGWLPIIYITLWFLTGLILMAIGIIGEYIGRNYFETKRRPRYIIEERLIH